MIEEIDSATYNKHFFEKVQCLCGACGDPRLPAGPAGRAAALRLAAFTGQLPNRLLKAQLPGLGLQVYQEVGSDPQAFLAAALDYMAKETPFFGQPGAADQVAALARRHTTAGAAAASAEPPTAAPAAAQAPAGAQPAQPDAPHRAAQGAAAPAAQPSVAPAEPAAEEEDEEGKGTGLSELLLWAPC